MRLPCGGSNRAQRSNRTRTRGPADVPHCRGWYAAPRLCYRSDPGIPYQIAIVKLTGRAEWGHWHQRLHRGLAVADITDREGPFCIIAEANEAFSSNASPRRVGIDLEETVTSATSGGEAMSLSLLTGAEVNVPSVNATFKYPASCKSIKYVVKKLANTRQVERWT